jgi:hypothetical protein
MEELTLSLDKWKTADVQSTTIEIAVVAPDVTFR